MRAARGISAIVVADATISPIMRVPGGRLRESQQRFESLFRAMPVPTYAWQRRGEDFILVAFNDAADVASRHRANESVGKSAREL
jgi:hypothetical protein